MPSLPCVTHAPLSYGLVVPTQLHLLDHALLGETLEQVAQRGGRCSIPGNIQGRVGQGSEHPDVVEDVPAHCRGVD